MTQKATIDEIQKVANKIRKQILGVHLKKVVATYLRLVLQLRLLPAFIWK